MPDSDLILNVRQIAGYPNAASTGPSDSVLIQQGGLGGPYASISPSALVETALSTGGVMSISGALTVGVVNGGSATFSNAAVGLFTAQTANVTTLAAANGSIAGVPIATTEFASALVAGLQASTVWSFNGRRGDVQLWLQDILKAGGAPIYTPYFQGTPMADTPWPGSNSNRLATTAFVQRAIPMALDCFLAEHPFVFSFNGRTGDVVLTTQDIIDAGGSEAVFDSPQFTGVPTAPTAPPGTDTDQLATTAFVATAISGASGTFAPINSPVFTGFPSGPTAAAGTSTGQLATTAFVQNAIVEATTGVASFNTRTGAVVLTGGDISAAGGALLVSPIFTGTPTGPTAAVGTSTQQLATTAFVMNELGGSTGGVASFNGRSGAVTLQATDVSGAGGALLASPQFSGVPLAPTAAGGTATTQIATTAFVMNEVGSEVTSWNGRTGAVTMTSADISAAGGAALNSPSFTGIPTAPTASAGNVSTQLATTAFVANAITSVAGVATFNGRSGTVTLIGSDITGAGGALLSSPTFTGVPNAPTASQGTSSQQIATTAFVMAAVGSGAGVTSFNTRVGAINLTAADVTGAGGALLASPGFSGVPTAPTAAAATSTTQIATTAFVQNALATGGGVTSFNSRTGAVTLTSADISAAGGAPIVSPAFTGAPTAPTAVAGTNTTQIATTAYVMAAIASGGGVLSFNGRAGAVTLTAADVSAAGGPYLPTAGGTVSGTLTVTGATTLAGLTQVGAATLGPSAHASTFDANGNLRIGGAAALPANAQAGHFYSPNGMFVGPVATGAVLSANIYTDGTNWRYLSTGAAAFFIAGANGSILQSFVSGSSGAVIGSQSGLFQFLANGNMTISGTLTQNSDARGKRDITAAPEGMDEVRRMTPRHYVRVMPPPMPEEDELGFVAQELQDAMPTAVLEDEKGGLSVALMPLIAALTNAVKELDARLAALGG